jgi:two-component system chemotaxis response regulator CheB
VRVLVADDSPTVAARLRLVLSADPEIEVVGVAANGHEAVTRVLELRPDLVTMDVDMPGIDGLEAVREIMSLHATPILIVTSPDVATRRNVAFEAVKAGALDMFVKPGAPADPDFSMEAAELRRQVKLLAGVRVISRSRREGDSRSARILEPPVMSRPRQPVELIAIGASTGGPKALADILRALPNPFPAAIVIVQHMAADFLPGLVEWLALQTTLPVRLAQGGEQVRRGVIYIAPGDRHLRVGVGGYLLLSEGAPRHSCCPSVDELFISVADVLGPHAIGVLLSGMGKDGAEGLLKMRSRAAVTVAQDESTSTVFGMPGAAQDLNAVEIMLPLERIGPMIVELAVGSLRPDKSDEAQA